MRRIHWLLVGLALAIGAGAVAQVVPGGLPSVPQFQAMFVSGQRPSVLRCVTASCIELGSTATGAVGGQLAMSNASAPLDSKVWDEYVDNTGCKNYRLINDALAGAFTWLNVCRTGVATNPVITFAGFRLPRTSFGEFIGNAGGCSNNSGVWQTQNLGGTCTRNSVGNYTIAFSTAYAGSPICIAQITSALAGIAGVNTAGTTSVTVQVGTTAFAAQDGSFFLRCDGF